MLVKQGLVLEDYQQRNMKRVVRLLGNGRLTFDFKKHPQGELLREALLLMCEVATHGTADGKPYIPICDRLESKQ
jgi:hypothetical protein